MTSSYKLEKIDDGHGPDDGSMLAVNTGKHSTGFACVFDNLMSEEWVDQIYDYAVKRVRPWGVYITRTEALDTAINSKALLESDPQRAMALEAVRALVYQRGRGLVGKVCRKKAARDVSSRSMFVWHGEEITCILHGTQDAEHTIHGTAIWCLVSDRTDTVRYHVDYAELFRLENNIIHPPLYGGTFHASPLRLGEMKGGSLMVNMDGLAHYKRFGYKGMLQSPECLKLDLRHGDWTEFKYKRNRGLLYDGDCPHLATPILDIPDGKKRVIMGFNCFSDAVSECNIRAPEHSDAFNRSVKLYQALKATRTDSVDTSLKDTDEKLEHHDTAGKKITAQEALKNPALARLIVLAARKIKEKGYAREAC